MTFSSAQEIKLRMKSLAVDVDKTPLYQGMISRFSVEERFG